jgi:hypothetical protein
LATQRGFCYGKNKKTEIKHMEYRQNSLEPYKAGSEETGEEAGESKSVKGGNLGLPFGLCAKYGIKLPGGATPRDAWNALKEHTGLTPDKVYSALESGKDLKTIMTTSEKPKEQLAPETTKAISTEQSDAQGTPEQGTNERKFVAKNYGVSEEYAQRAKEAYSFSDYKQGSATASYNSDIGRFERNVNALMEQYKNNTSLTEEDWDRVQRIAEKYSENLANFTNEYNRVEASYPSWVIAGPAKYNTRKNDAKHSRLRSLYEENSNRLDPDKNVYLDKIKGILSNASVKSNDSNAIGKLQMKYDKLKAELENGKAMNAYFRKNKTLVGFPGVSDEQAKQFDTAYNSGDYFSRQPYPSFSLANGNAELRRIQGRIDELNKAQAAAQEAKANPEAAKAAIAARYPKVDGVNVEENAEQMRVQLRFPDKPDATTRDMLKSHGFRWSPSQNAWQRQLNNNGRYAARQIMEQLSRGKEKQ